MKKLLSLAAVLALALSLLAGCTGGTGKIRGAGESPARLGFTADRADGII